jgi:hypothetical protein
MATDIDNYLQANQRIRSLLLILIFTFVASGITLAVLAQIQNYENEQGVLNDSEVKVIFPERNKLQANPLSTPAENINVHNWKVYRNDKYGFEISHPDFISVYESIIKSDIYITFEPTNYKKDYAILIYPVGGYNINSWLPSKSYTSQISNKEALVKEIIDENGYLKIITILSPPAGWNKDNQIVLIYSNLVQKELVDYYAFSTFKFIK